MVIIRGHCPPPLITTQLHRPQPFDHLGMSFTFILANFVFVHFDVFCLFGVCQFERYYITNTDLALFVAIKSQFDARRVRSGKIAKLTTTAVFLQLSSSYSIFAGSIGAQPNNTSCEEIILFQINWNCLAQWRQNADQSHK